MHKKNIEDAVRDEKIKHNKEINEIKQKHTEYRLDNLEKK